MISKKIKTLIIITTLITGFLGVKTTAVEAKVIPRSYTITSASTYELTYQFTVTNTNSAPAQVDIEFPLGNEKDESPYIISASDFSTSDSNSTITNSNGSETLKIALPRLNPFESKVIVVKMNIKTGAINYQINSTSFSNDYSDFENYSKYTSPGQGIESTNVQIKQKADELTKNLSNPYEKAKAIYHFVVSNMTYTTDTAYANKGALNALQTGKGVCEEYVDLFVALCRAEAIPARAVNGYSNHNKLNLNDSSDLPITHAWAEFYLPEYGWVFAEPTIIGSTSESDEIPYFGRNDVPYKYIFTGYDTFINSAKVSCSGFLTNPNNIQLSFDKTMKKISDDGDVQITPYSSYDSRLSETEKSVVKAETSSLDTDIASAKELVNTLIDGQNKTDLLNRLNNIMSYADKLATATAAVSKAEGSKVQADVDSAKKLVNTLNDTDKASLNTRLNTVQTIINSNISAQQALKNASDSLAKAESTKLQSDVDNAKSLVNLLPAGSDRDSLTSRLNVVQKAIDDAKGQATTYTNQLAAATDAVAKAEGSKIQDDVNSARTLVNDLKDADKTPLNSRLNTVQTIINSNISAQQALKNATNAVAKAESTKLQSDVDFAKNLVSVLPSGSEKDSLTGRLSVVQKAIDDAKAQTQATTYANELTAATNAVTKAEGSKLQDDVNNARTLVNTLKDTDKATLGARLAAVQTIINNNTSAQQTLTNTTNAVIKAESSKIQSDVDVARGLVDSLPIGSNRASLSSRLDVVQKAIDYVKSQATAYANQLSVATDAVTKAEGSKVQAKVDSARTLVNALKDADKSALNSRLDAVQTIINNNATAQQALSNATNAVAKAESTKLQSDVDFAKNLVSVLPSGSEKDSLTGRSSVVQKAIDDAKAQTQATTYANQLTVATNAVTKAEDSKLQDDVNNARTLVNTLKDTDKATLGARLAVVQTIINNNTSAQQTLTNTTNAVIKAESSKIQSDVDVARGLVNLLPIGINRASLSTRLDVVQKTIDDTKTQNDAKTYQKQLEAATNAVAKAERSVLQSDVDLARNLVSNLKNTDKNTLGARLDVVQSIIDKNTLVTQQALSKATDAVVNAENSEMLSDLNIAWNLVYKLPYNSKDQTSLINRLNEIQKNINEKFNFTNAKDAVSKAEESKLDKDISYANMIINSLSNINNKKALKNRLKNIDNRIVTNYKTWTVTFTGDVGFDDTTKANLTVTDSKGKKVDVDIEQGYDSKSLILIAPYGGYKKGESYVLTIGPKAHSSKGKPLNKTIKINFKISK